MVVSGTVFKVVDGSEVAVKVVAVSVVALWAVNVRGCWCIDNS